MMIRVYVYIYIHGIPLKSLWEFASTCGWKPCMYPMVGFVFGGSASVIYVGTIYFQSTVANRLFLSGACA